MPTSQPQRAWRGQYVSNSALDEIRRPELISGVEWLLTIAKGMLRHNESESRAFHV